MSTLRRLTKIASAPRAGIGRWPSSLPRALFVPLFAVAMVSAAPASAESSNESERLVPGVVPQAEIAELKRKASADEKDDGFCARLAWTTPPLTVAIAVNGAPRAGRLHWYRFEEICGVIEVGRQELVGGHRLRKVGVWFCRTGDTCLSEERVFCQAKDAWEPQTAGQCVQY